MIAEKMDPEGAVAQEEVEQHSECPVGMTVRDCSAHLGRADCSKVEASLVCAERVWPTNGDSTFGVKLARELEGLLNG